MSSIELSVQRVESGGELSKAATSDIMHLQVRDDDYIPDEDSNNNFGHLWPSGHQTTCDKYGQVGYP